MAAFKGGYDCEIFVRQISKSIPYKLYQKANNIKLYTAANEKSEISLTHNH